MVALVIWFFWVDVSTAFSFVCIPFLLNYYRNGLEESSEVKALLKFHSKDHSLTYKIRNMQRKKAFISNTPGTNGIYTRCCCSVCKTKNG